LKSSLQFKELCNPPSGDGEHLLYSSLAAMLFYNVSRVVMDWLAQ